MKNHWEMIAVLITLLSVIYMVGKKEGIITTEIQQNRQQITEINNKIDKLTVNVTEILAVEKSKQASYKASP